MSDSLATVVFHEFETVQVIIQRMMGNGTEGAVVFNFFTRFGVNFRTISGPKLTQQIFRSLQDSIGDIPRLPIPPNSTLLGLDVAGKQKAPETVTYFGQEYDPSIIQGLGVLMIRANLLEQSLVKLFQVLAEIPIEKASAVFFSTVNMKARIDMIQALVPFSGLNEEMGKHLVKALNKSKDVVGRRNDLVHATWSFDGARLKAETYQPNASRKRKEIPVSAHSIETLAADYREAGLRVEAMCDTIPAFKYIALNTAATASSTSPSS